MSSDDDILKAGRNICPDLDSNCLILIEFLKGQFRRKESRIQHKIMESFSACKQLCCIVNFEKKSADDLKNLEKFPGMQSIKLNASGIRDCLTVMKEFFTYLIFENNNNNRRQVVNVFMIFCCDNKKS